MSQPDDVVESLRGQLERYDPERYPVQHATARFHLGAALIHAGDLDAAIESLEVARELFPLEGLPVERAKAENMLGVALRDRGQPERADEAFTRAAEAFDREGHAVEAAASRFNRGMALRDAGRTVDAVGEFTAALAAMEHAQAFPHAAAAAREVGTTLLALRRLDEAVEPLERAMELSRRGGDRAGLGAAANVLGIVHLQADRPAAARDAFADAAGAHPRAVRPADHAMARANLALAYERDGEPALAALTARQALAIQQASPEVAEQARGVFDRCVAEAADPLAAALERVAPERWPGVLRAEFARLAQADATDVEAHARAMVGTLMGGGEQAIERAAAWLEVLLEQPPALFHGVVDATVDAAGDADEARRAVGRAMARFHVPQWMRLKDSFNDAAVVRGQEPAWG